MLMEFELHSGGENSANTPDPEIPATTAPDRAVLAPQGAVQPVKYPPAALPTSFAAEFRSSVSIRNTATRWMNTPVVGRQKNRFAEPASADGRHIAKTALHWKSMAYFRPPNICPQKRFCKYVDFRSRRIIGT